jgi:hypothetical protein
MVLRILSIAFTLFYSVHMLAAVIKINGTPVNATELKFVPGTMQIASGKVVEPVEVPLSERNSVTITEYFWLNNEGNISMLSSPGLMNWEFEDGSSLVLNCRKKFISGVEQNRMVSFHPNGVYHMGCEAMGQRLFSGHGHSIDVRFGSSVDFQEDESVEYATMVSGDSQVKVGDKLWSVQAGSSVGIYKNGNVRVFKPAKGESVELKYLDPLPSLKIESRGEGSKYINLQEDGSFSVAPITVLVYMFNQELVEIPAEIAMFGKENRVAAIGLESYDKTPVELREYAIYFGRLQKPILCFGDSMQLLTKSDCLKVLTAE